MMLSRKNCIQQLIAQRNKRIPRLLLKTGYWLLPALILFLIFSALDVAELKSILTRVNPWIVLAGGGFFPLAVFVGFFRWKTALQHFLRRRVDSGFICKHYWIGLALGWFLPTTVTWDVYRVVVVGKKYGNYSGLTAAVILEKIVSLIVGIFFIVALYPFIVRQMNPNYFLTESVQEIVSIARDMPVFYYGLIICIILSLIGAALYLIKVLLERIKKNRINELLQAMTNPRLLTLFVLYSMGSYLCIALANYLFFSALQTPLPLAIHFVLRPVFLIILLLPLSFGGIGVREGAYILVYGFFGVSMEIALVAAFMNYFANLLNAGIGGIVMLLTKSRVKDCDEIR